MRIITAVIFCVTATSLLAQNAQISGIVRDSSGALTRGWNLNVSGGLQIDLAAFSIPTNREGDLGRKALRGFDLSQTDISLSRTFPIHERFKLIFRGELFNVLNHPNLANPISDLGNALFGISTAMAKDQIGGGGSTTGGQSYGLNGLFQVGGPRSVQLSLKLNF